MYAASRPAFNRRDLAFVVALHGAAVWGLLRMNLISLPAPLAVLSVRLLQPAAAIKPEPEIVPPKPRSVARQPTPVQLPTQLAAPAESPAPTPVAVAPAPAVQSPVAATPAPASVPTQPRFDADYLDNPRPPYPAISRRLGEQGRVVLRVLVETDGRAADLQLHASSGSPRLDHAALDTVRRWKFIPARLGKESIAAWVLVPIAFTLKD